MGRKSAVSAADEYQAKLVSGAEAVLGISSDSNVSMGMALGEPPALLEALAGRLDAGELDRVRLWYFHSMPDAARTVLRYDLMDRVQPHCMFLGPIERDLIAKGDADGRKVVNFVPVAFSDAPRLLSREIQLDTFLTVVSPMDQHGYFSFGANNDYASTAARSARRTIVEVNRHMPRVFGDSMIHVSEVDAIIENHAPLYESKVRKPAAVDETIGDLIAELVPGGSCLQMGIGALPNAVCRKLMDRADLGIHTELLSPGLVDLIESGAVEGDDIRFLLPAPWILAGLAALPILWWLLRAVPPAPPHGWWIMMRECGRALRFPLAPAARRNEPIDAAIPMQMVFTGARRCCMVS